MNRKNSPVWVKGLLILVGSVLGMALVTIGVLAVLDVGRSPEKKFTDIITSRIAGAEDVTARDNIGLGMAVCSAEEAGLPRDIVVEQFVKNGFTPREADIVIDAANEYLCELGTEN